MPQKSFTASATGPTAAWDAGAGKAFSGLKFEVICPYAPDYVVALETSPDSTTWTEQARIPGSPGNYNFLASGNYGSKWGYARSDHAQRYVLANVISTGSGNRLTVVVTAVSVQ